MLRALFTIIIFALQSHAFEVPKDFEATNSFGATANFWIQPKTLETVGLADEDVSALEPSKDDFAEISEVMDAKAKALPAILNIKEYKLSGSKQIKTQNGKVILFFGSYIDSSDDLAHFAELYVIPSKGKPAAYLLTRPKSEWTEKEIFARFRVEL